MCVVCTAITVMFFWNTGKCLKYAHLLLHQDTLADTITGVDWTLHKGGEKMCPVIA